MISKKRMVFRDDLAEDWDHWAKHYCIVGSLAKMYCMECDWLRNRAFFLLNVKIASV